MRAAIAGSNRSGISRAPDLASAMVKATKEFRPSSSGDATAISEVRAEYAKSADPFATMPPPAGVAQLAKNALRTVVGKDPTLLLDKLGERLVFELAGTRLYDAIISKHDAGRSFRGGPSRDDLVHIRDEEHQHAGLIEQAIKELGGDPTVVTPSANLQATASKGLSAVLADPRTDVLQGLEALLTAELVDNDCWPTLLELLEQEGLTEVAKRLECAIESEREHLEKVRTWLATGLRRSPDRALRAGDEVKRQAKPRADESTRESSRPRPKGGRVAKQSGARSSAGKQAGAGKTKTARRRSKRASRSR